MSEHIFKQIFDYTIICLNIILLNFILLGIIPIFVSITYMLISFTYLFPLYTVVVCMYKYVEQTLRVNKMYKNKNDEKNEYFISYLISFFEFADVSDPYIFLRP